MIFLTCEMCGNPFPTYPSHASRRKFCSKRCQGRSRAGANNGKYKGGWIQRGYKKVRHDGRYVFEHRLIAARSLGRNLNASEVVHHVNGDTLDNRPENLRVMPSQAEHARQHTLGARWARRYDSCTDCGTTERPHEAKGLCRPCYKRWRYHAALPKPV